MTELDPNEIQIGSKGGGVELKYIQTLESNYFLKGKILREQVQCCDVYIKKNNNNKIHSSKNTITKSQSDKGHGS